MPRGRVGRLLALLGLAALAWGAHARGALAQGCATCAQPCEGGVCQKHDCPPWFHHCQERPPVICINCGCPRPICNPCKLPNFGYFQTCWTPWPLPPDWSHCKVPPPAAYVQLNNQMAVPGAPSAAPAQMPPGSATYPSPQSNGPPVMAPTPEVRETFPQPAPFVPGPGMYRNGQ